VTIKRAHHDLNGVKVIEVSGWRGPVEITEHEAAGGVTVSAPQRHDGESWTFEHTDADGVLRCFTNLRTSPDMLTESLQPLFVYLPSDSIPQIEVRFTNAMTTEAAK
jgi:hypothetical protein